jgi:hypothetical protein
MTTDSPAATSIDADPEMFHGLTIWCGEPKNVRISAQIRDAGQLAVHIGPAAERSTEDNHPVILPADDARRIRDLLNVATARGIL